MFKSQIEFQQEVLRQRSEELKLPADSPSWFAYHTNAMTEEMGELLKADKRWKTHRNTHYDNDEKLKELADVFITAINLATYSGYESYTVYGAIMNKIAENTEKLKKGAIK